MSKEKVMTGWIKCNDYMQDMASKTYRKDNFFKRWKRFWSGVDSETRG